MDKKLLRAAVVALSVAWLAALALVIDGEGPSTLVVPSIGVGFTTLVYLRRTAREGASPSTTPQEERRSRRFMTSPLRPDRGVSDTHPQIRLSLWRSDAVVLFDWLMTVDLNRVPIGHPAEKQALMDLLTALDQSAVDGVTQTEIDEARSEVAHDMSW